MVLDCRAWWEVGDVQGVPPPAARAQWGESKEAHHTHHHALTGPRCAVGNRRQGDQFVRSMQSLPFDCHCYLSEVNWGCGEWVGERRKCPERHCDQG